MHTSRPRQPQLLLPLQSNQRLSALLLFLLHPLSLPTLDLSPLLHLLSAPSLPSRQTSLPLALPITVWDPPVFQVITTYRTSSPGWGKIKTDRMLYCSHSIDRPVSQLLLYLPNLRLFLCFFLLSVSLHLWHGGNKLCKRREHHFISLLLYYTSKAIASRPLAICLHLQHLP